MSLETPAREDRPRHTHRESGMSYRTILVPIGQPDNAEGAIQAAFLVARRFAGHVRGLHVLPDLANPATHALMATRMSLEAASSDFRKFKGSAERELQRQSSELRRLFETAAARAGAALESAPAEVARLSASWQEVTGFESELVGTLGRVFDLTVIARRGPRGSSHDTVQAALLDTGRPMLLTPPAMPDALGDVVLLAWNASPQAARVTASALPFLQSAGRVVVMSVGNGPEPAPSADDLARALAWHGISAQARHIEQGSRRVRDILLAEAAAMAADLLIIGAYSHSRMRQVVFGGVTEHMLDHAELPVLMAH
jgi:nucleotide-binding universal stress UspA family protein